MNFSPPAARMVPRQARLFPQTVVVSLLIGLAGLTVLLQWLMLHFPYLQDEAVALYFVQRPLRQIIHFLGYDMHPPLFFILLHGWVKLFGDSPQATGALSLLFSFFTLWYLWRLGRLFFSPRTAALGVWLYWVSQTGFFFSTFSWGYSVAIAAATASTYYLLRWLGDCSQRRWLLWYLVSTLLALYAHYGVFLLVYAQNVVVSLYVVRHREKNFPMLSWVIGQFLLVLGFSPWLPVMVRQIYLNHFVLPSLQLGLATLPLPNYLLQNWMGMLLAPGFFPLVGKIFWGIVVIALVAKVTEIKVSPWQVTFALRSQHWSFVALAALIAIPGLWLAVLQVAEWPWRYIVYVAPLSALFVGAAVASFPFPRWVKLPSLCLVVVTPLLINSYFMFVYLRPLGHFAWSSVADYLSAAGKATPRAVILMGAFEERHPFQYYYRGALPVIGFLPSSPDPRLPIGEEGEVVRFFSRVVDERNVTELAEVVGPYRWVWSVRGFSGYYLDPDNLVDRWLSTHCVMVGEPQYFPPEGVSISVNLYTNCRSLLQS